MGLFHKKEKEDSHRQMDVETSSTELSDIEKCEVVKPQRRMFTPFFNKKVPHVPTPEERIVYPMRKSNFLSRVFFWWMVPLMVTGYKRTIEPEDLFYLEDSMKVEISTAKFYSHFHRRLDAAKKQYLESKGLPFTEENKALLDTRENPDFEDFQYPRHIVAAALFQTFRYDYCKSLVLKVIGDLGTSFNPLLSKALINFVEEKALSPDLSVGKGLGYAIGSALLVWVRGLLLTHYFHDASLVGAQVKAVLTKVILDKSLKLNGQSKHDYSAGTITSIMGTDLARIDLSVGYQAFIVTFPVPVIITIGLLIANIGVPSLTGMAVFILTSSAITYATRQLLQFRKKANVFTDGRVNLVKELLNNLKIIKYYSWETPYEKNITSTRTQEMNIIFKMQILRNFVTAFAVSLPAVSSMIAFVVMYASEGLKSNAKVFTSLTLFNVLSQQIMMLPIALSSTADGLIGLDRVRGFLQSGEIKEEDNQFFDKLQSDSKTALRVSNATFEWETFVDDDAEAEKSHELVEKMPLVAGQDALKTTAFPGLNDIDFEVKKGEFIIITGLIGSGKSSLLNAMAGFMKKKAGSVQVSGSLLLCGYPWVQNATVKENILFGSAFNDKKYREVLHCCALESDLEILPAGDRTEIGERGITLSGGQKARINLARAVYADKEIILLDDVLSAVDARVGKHIMDNCLTGLLKDKTRVLATHQLSLINSADRVIFLNGDGSIDIGTVEQLRERNQGFSHLMEFNTEAHEDEEEAEKQEEEEVELIKKQTTNRERADGKLSAAEDRGVNGIKLNIYTRFINLGSGVFSKAAVPLFLFLVMSSTFCALFTNVWLSFWTSKKFPQFSNAAYIGFYVMFTCLTVIFTIMQFALLVYITNRASRKLNIMSLKKILHTPMAFLDVTPMGQVLNRFTKDTDVLDNEMAEQARLFVYSLSMVFGVLILCMIYLPWFTIAVPFLIFLYISVSNFYGASAREIKRIESVQRSFVYNNFNETLNGIDTIKSYKVSSMFLNKNSRLIDNMNEAYFVSIANQRWMAISLHSVGSLLALIVTLLCACRVFKISSAGVGLLTSYVLQIAGTLTILIKASTQLENQMTSVERLCHYAYDLPQEAAYEISETKPAPEWPQSGSIEFKNVSMSYRPGLPHVLKNLSFGVKPGEKIGICGRTGAGKSSIMTALYRLSELDIGHISIDGVITSKIGLKDLRSKLSIIPQDPVLFQGSLRKNLDPFAEQPDDVLWDALRRSGLIEGDQIERVKQQSLNDENLHKFHLSQLVEDEGANFSLGERQLMALARALVRNSKILILDEATSSVDYETDAKIQHTIANEFGHCTILCIAHRLKTIIDYDKILVLEKGQIEEFDTPWNLFNLDGGIFQSMCEKSNIMKEDFNLN